MERAHVQDEGHLVHVISTLYLMQCMEESSLPVKWHVVYLLVYPPIFQVSYTSSGGAARNFEPSIITTQQWVKDYEC